MNAFLSQANGGAGSANVRRGALASETVIPRTYALEEIERILGVYQDLFPASEITPALRSYWGLERGLDIGRPWSYLTTDFHRVRPETLLQLHNQSVAISDLKLPKQEHGAALRMAAQRLDAGFSIGLCPWTDNMLFETATTRANWRELVVVVGHDWYPIGDSPPLESPLWEQGLHHTSSYRMYCPESFFGPRELRPFILYLNFYPDFRRPGAKRTGLLPQRNNPLPYRDCMAGFKELLRVVRPKFERTVIISWGAAWSAMSRLVDGGPVNRTIKYQQNEAPGEVLLIDGVPYFPMAHPSFGSNQHKQHLLKGYNRLGLGLAEFALRP